MDVDDLTKEVICQGLINNVYKYCASCGLLLEKDGGCNYVKCFCGCEMCWNCGLIKYLPLGCNNKEHNSH